VWVEQAVFTSLPRRGRGGYHVVSRSPGVPEADASALSTWSPSNGSLIVDASNSTSVNFHPLPSGRLALSRTCAGPPEYSGRGERQLYTHALILEWPALRDVGSQPIALYRDALAQGLLRYQSDPDPDLKPVELGALYGPRDPASSISQARTLGLPSLDQLKEHLSLGKPFRYSFSGDRIALVECLLGVLPIERIPRASFSTSLQPSAVRPFLVSLVN
jgi:GTPase-associated protein 1, N-terminal domain type 2